MAGKQIFKVSKRTNRICMGLAIAALVAIFCYQVAYGTNESDYKWGYKYGFRNYLPYDQRPLPYDQLTGQGVDVAICKLSTNHISNATACVDGYMNGFIDWCSIHKNDCAFVLKIDAQPSHNQTMIEQVGNITKNME